tara:strand:- start:5845 stop:7119 length:1275 start_codon:yes stop_codon:yes gene_type:complete
MKNKFPPLLIMEKIHSEINNLDKFPWYVLASPFFSKINDNQDSSFEFIARENFKEYKSTNYEDTLIKSILKNLIIGCKTFLVLLFKSQLKIKTKRKINNKSLVVDYYKNKNTNNTILEFHYKNIIDPLVWIVDSNIGYDKELEKFSIFELLSFLTKILISIFYLPYKELGFLFYLLEISRNLNMFYTFKYFLAGNDLKNFSVENLHILYEDQPRDRIIIQDNIKLNIYGYIHTSLIHHWRLNKFFSNSDIFIPNNLIFADNFSYQAHLKNKFKKIPSNISVRSFSSIYLQKKINQEIVKKEFENILIFMPKDKNLTLELFSLAEKLKNEIKNCDIICFPHPNFTNYNFKNNPIKHLLNPKRDLVISSHKTNKGYELFKENFEVIYFGSDNYTFYKPFDQIPIKFAEGIYQLRIFINAILKKNNY